MRKPIIAANWKMHKTESEAKEFAEAFKPLVKGAGSEVVVCGPFTLLSTLKTAFSGSNVAVGAQNVHFEEKGAFTGEISASMVKEFARYVIIGHSERRKIFHESDEMLNKKVKKALEHGLEVIFCVGETLDEREKGVTTAVIEQQIRLGLHGVSDLSHVSIAYEPVWAIGTGKTATPEQAEEVHAGIRRLIADMYGLQPAADIRILYGGSVKPDNAKELMAKEDIDGALVGGAALDAKSFAGIVNY